MTPADLFDAAITAARSSPNQVRKVGAVLLPGDGGPPSRPAIPFPRVWPTPGSAISATDG